MAASVLKDGFPKAHLTTGERVESSIDLRRLFAVIDADPAIAGAGVVYLDAQLWLVTLREFQPICSVLPKRVILREMPRSMARLDFVRRLENEPRESQLVCERGAAEALQLRPNLSCHVDSVKRYFGRCFGLGRKLPKWSYWKCNDDGNWFVRGDCRVNESLISFLIRYFPVFMGS